MKEGWLIGQEPKITDELSFTVILKSYMTVLQQLYGKKKNA